MSLSIKHQNQAIKNKWISYPIYKEAGITWIKSIPKNWQVQKLKRTCKLITDGSHYSPPSQQFGKSYITVKDLLDNDIDFENSLKISDEDFNLLVKNGCKPQIGDVLISKDGTIGKVVIVKNDDFVILSSIALLRPNSDVDSSYLRYFFLSTYGLNQMLSYIAGTAIRRLTVETIIDLIIVKPPLLEQKAISKYLDSQTARLDALIAKKERLIELLQEKRTAIINQSVTQGLTSYAPMKASNILGIEKIPQDWETQRLKDISFINQNVLSEDTSPEFNIFYIDISNIDSNGNINGGQDYKFDKAPSRARRIVKNGDTIISTVRTYLRAISFISNPPTNLIVSTGFAVLTPKPNVYPRYLWRLVQSDQFINAVVSHSEGVGYPAINPSTLSDLHTWLPPKDEQIAICSHVDNETLKIDNLIEKIKISINLLKEYRAALISAVVTGKIDVRGEA